MIEIRRMKLDPPSMPIQNLWFATVCIPHIVFPNNRLTKSRTSSAVPSEAAAVAITVRPRYRPSKWKMLNLASDFGVDEPIPHAARMPWPGHRKFQFGLATPQIIPNITHSPN